jgi:hypothetical protein
MMKTLKPTKTLKKILNTRKSKVFVLVRSTHNVSPSYWDSGSRTLTYTVNGTSLNTVTSVNNPFANEKNPKIELNDDTIIVELGTFQGQEATPCIIVKTEEALKGLVQ